MLLRVGGEIDQATVHTVERGVGQALAAAGQVRATRVLLDLEQVGFMGSAGLTVLIRAHGDATGRGVALVLVVPAGHQVARLLQVTEFDLVVDTAASVAQALADG